MKLFHSRQFFNFALALFAVSLLGFLFVTPSVQGQDSCYVCEASPVRLLCNPPEGFEFGFTECNDHEGEGPCTTSGNSCHGEIE